MFSKKECLAIFLLCVLPWAAILLYLNHSFASTVLSLCVTLALNLFYLYLFGRHFILKNHRLVFKITGDPFFLSCHKNAGAV